MKKLFVIAGEASGDRLGGSLLAAIKERFPDIIIAGIGGDDMKQNGLPQSLFPMEQLSVMGLAEIIPAMPRILYRLQQTVSAIEAFQPDLVLSIDNPDFTQRVHRQIQKNGRLKTRHVHMVAPSVWAWRPGRAQKWGQVIDQLLCLLPFEPPYFANTPMRADFVGHPVTERLQPLPRGKNDVVARLGIRGGPIVGLLCGSRIGEIRRVGNQIVEAAQLLAMEFPGLHFIVPTLPWIEKDVRALCARIPAYSHVLTDQSDKYMAMGACDAAIAVSGTIGLELAMLEVPHIITYRLNPLTWQVAKRMIQVRYAHLVNILQDAPVVPEFLQNDSQPEMMASAMIELLKDGQAQANQLQAFRNVRAQLQAPRGFTAASAAVEAIVQGGNPTH
ncbi:MAG: lipid-A-disaccharide synthase [Pseudomonadota bacterium]